MALTLLLLLAALPQTATSAEPAAPPAVPAPAVPALSFLDAGAEGLKLSTISASLASPLTLVETGGKAGAAGEVLEVLLTSGSQSTSLKAVEPSFSIGISGAASVLLEGRIPAVGLWKGTVVVAGVWGRVMVPITVERVEAAGLPTLEALSPPVFNRWPWARELPVQVRLRESGKRPVHVRSLTLVRLQPPGTPVDQRAREDIRACWSDQPPGACTSCAETCLTDAIAANTNEEIPAGEARTWWLTMDAPWAAGVWTGAVEVTTLEGDAVPAATFSVHLRHPWPACVLTVTLGALLSLVLRGWRGGQRAAALAQLPLARLGEVIDALPDGPLREQMKAELARLRSPELAEDARAEGFKALTERVQQVALADLRARLGRLKERVEVDLARAEDAALKERIQALRDQLLAVEPTGTDAELHRSLTRRLNLAVDALEEIEKTLPTAAPTGPREMGGDGIPTSESIRKALGVDLPWPEIQWPDWSRKSARQLQIWLRGIDAFVLVVTVLIAGLLAVVQLWSASTTWGGLGDYVTALVWGFGAHRLTQKAVEPGKGEG